MQTVTTIGLDIAKSVSSPRRRSCRLGHYAPCVRGALSLRRLCLPFSCYYFCGIFTALVGPNPVICRITSPSLAQL
jgi:hypothetical protein